MTKDKRTLSKSARKAREAMSSSYWIAWAERHARNSDAMDLLILAQAYLDSAWSIPEPLRAKAQGAQSVADALEVLYANDATSRVWDVLDVFARKERELSNV